MTALVALLTVVVILLVVLVAGLLRSHAEILRRLHEIGAGEDDAAVTGLGMAPRRGRPGETSAITGATPTGGSVSVPLVGSRGKVLLAFLSSGCATCRPFWSTFAATHEMPTADTRLVIVTRGPDEESPAEIAALAADGLTVVMASGPWDEMRVPVSPYFALVDASSGTVIGEGAAGSWEQVSDLLGRAAADAGWAEGTGTRARLRRSDDELRRAGIGPDDPSLHREPGEPPP